MKKTKKHRYFLSKEDLIPEIRKWEKWVKSKKDTDLYVGAHGRYPYTYVGARISDNYAIFIITLRDGLIERKSVLFCISTTKIVRYSYKFGLHRVDGPAYIDEHGYSFFINDERCTFSQYYAEPIVKEKILSDLIGEVLDEG